MKTVNPNYQVKIHAKVYFQVDQGINFLSPKLLKNMVYPTMKKGFFI